MILNYDDPFLRNSFYFSVCTSMGTVYSPGGYLFMVRNSILFLTGIKILRNLDYRGMVREKNVIDVCKLLNFLLKVGQ